MARDLPRRRPALGVRASRRRAEELADPVVGRGVGGDVVVAQLGHQLAAERVDQRLLVGVDQVGAERRSGAVTVPPAAATCSVERADELLVGAGHGDDRDRVVGEPAAVQGRGARAVTNGVGVVGRRRCPSAGVGAVVGRRPRLIVAADVGERAAAQDDADGERQEDGDEVSDVVRREITEAVLGRCRSGRTWCWRRGRDVVDPLLADGGDAMAAAEGQDARPDGTEQVPRADRAGVEPRQRGGVDEVGARA